MKQSKVRKLTQEGYQKFLNGVSETQLPTLYKTIKAIIDGTKK